MIYKNSYINFFKPILGVNSNAHGMSCLVDITDTLKGCNLLSLPKKNKALNNILNQYIEDSYADKPSLLGDFYEQRAQNHH